MTDRVTDERLHAAFTRFRTQAREEIQMPGADEVHRTVRRRRTRRVAVVAAVIALGLTGAGLVAGLRNGRDRATPPAAPSTPTRLPDDALEALAAQALRAVGVTPQTHRPGVAFGPVSSYGTGVTTFGTAAEPLAAGDYELRAACMGSGEVTLTVVGAAGTGSVVVPCGGSAVAQPFTLSTPQTLTFGVHADAEARARAGLAVVITDPREVAAAAALGPAPAAQVLSGHGPFEGVTYQDEFTDAVIRVGRYDLVVACVGGGRMTARLQVDGATGALDVPCDGRASTIHATARTARVGTITVLFDPDASASTAAVAYRVVQP